MACTSCGSEKQTKLGAEMNIHFPGREGLDKPTVWAFPKLVVCLDCGSAQFTLQDTELVLIVKGIQTSEPSIGQKSVGLGRARLQDCA
jgi:hypothetical protein